MTSDLFISAISSHVSGDVHSIFYICRIVILKNIFIMSTTADKVYER